MLPDPLSHNILTSRYTTKFSPWNPDRAFMLIILTLGGETVWINWFKPPEETKYAIRKKTMKMVMNDDQLVLEVSLDLLFLFNEYSLALASALECNVPFEDAMSF